MISPEIQKQKALDGKCDECLQTFNTVISVQTTYEAYLIQDK